VRCHRQGLQDRRDDNRDDAAFEQVLSGVTLDHPSMPDDLVGVAIFQASPGSEWERPEAGFRERRRSLCGVQPFGAREP
jgi:hypothetical protein